MVIMSSESDANSKSDRRKSETVTTSTSEGTSSVKRKSEILKKPMAKPDDMKLVYRVTKTIVTSEDIYKPLGSYSQAILVDKTLYVSGTLGLDIDGQLVCGGAEAEARQALDNLKFVLEAGGASLQSVVKTTILLADINDFQAVNQVYSEYFPRDCPTRATYQVGKLPKNAAIEIECIALSGDLVIAEAGPCPCARN